VNEERVQGQRVLARGDVIRIGEESFRFYADAAPAAPAAPSPPAAAPPSVNPPKAAPRLQNTAFGMPAAPRPQGSAPAAPPAPAPELAPAPRASSGGAPLGNFLVRTGSMKGQRLTIRTPVVNIGRADYNDLMLSDDSVSTSHA